MIKKFLSLSLGLSIHASVFSMGEKRNYETVDVTVDDQVCSLAKAAVTEISRVPSLLALAAKKIGLHCTQFSLDQLQYIQSQFPDEMLAKIKQELIIAHFGVFLQALEDCVAFEYVNYLAVSPERNYALISTENDLEFLDFQNPFHIKRGVLQHYLNEDKVIDIAFNVDGTRALTLTESGRACLWNFSARQEGLRGSCIGKFFAGCLEGIR